MIDEIAKQYEGRIPAPLIDEVKKEAKEVKLSKAQLETVFTKLEEKYKYAKIQAGEAIGIVTAESFGEPGTQMSTDYNEKLILKINNKIQILKAGEFIDNIIQLKGSLKLNEHSEILPLHDVDVYVPSLNQEEKIEWKKVIECSRHTTEKKLLRLKTASGRQIICTDNHSFVTRINNSIIPMKGSELNLGNKIPIINNMGVEKVTEKIDVKEFYDAGYVFENEDGYLETNHNAKSIPRFMELNPSTGWFIGAYLAEGSTNGGQLNISNMDDNYMSHAKIFLDNLNVSYTEDYHHRGFANARDLKSNSTLLSKLMIKSCGQGSRFKKVPEFAYSASNACISALLRGYFDGDGNFHVSRRMIRVSSNSKELSDGIALLLARFKIFAYKTIDKKGQHWLLIPYKYAPLYMTHIGSDIEYKKLSLEKLAERGKKFWNEKSQDYTDTISGFGDLFYRTSKKLAYPTRYTNSSTQRQKIGRGALYRHMKTFEMLAKEKNIDIKEELEIMKRMFYSDVVWDDIVEKEYVENKHKYVYDLSVPGLETFTTFDGIITHNTLRTFHFAGVAEVNVTLGLPRLIEIFDARKEPSTPLMTIYLKKPYNKDDKYLEKIIAQIKEIRVQEVLSEISINLLKLHIEYVLNKKRMKELGINEEAAVKAIKDSLKAVDISEKDGRYTAVPKNKEGGLPALYTLKERIKDVKVNGIDGIQEVIPKMENTEIMLLASGSNLKEVYKIAEVDYTRTITNNIFEVAKNLGIEAARQTIIAEASKVIGEQGLDIDIRHIMFIADLMTAKGEIKGITRSGITEEKESVLARASFETPIRHLINASLVGEVDMLNSVVENVMINQPIPLGTGLPSLITKLAKENKK